MILLIDNYDSFTYNLYHYLASWGRRSKSFVTTRSALTISPSWDRRKLSSRLVPARLNEAGISCDAILRFR